MVKKSDVSFKSIVLLLVIILLVVSTIIASYVIFSSDHIEELIQEKKNIIILFSFSEENTSSIIELFLYNTSTHKGAIIYIPGNLWTMIDSLNKNDKYDKIKTAYNPQNLTPLIKTIEKITNLNIPFFFDIQFTGITKLVDLIGGLNVENRSTIENEINGHKVIFKKGITLLDGERIIDFLTFAKKDESDSEQDQRKLEFLKSLLKTMAFKQTNQLLLGSEPQQYFERIIKTNLTSKEIFSFVQELKNLRTNNIISTRVRGIEKTNKDGETVLFPLEEGEYLKFTIQHALDIIANEELITDENMTIKLEILNGTEINQLALNTANLFKQYGYQIEFFGNAEKHDYETTVVIDRKGKKEIVKKVADLIKCKNVVNQPAQDPTTAADITIILGKDFDGQYCK